MLADAEAFTGPIFALAEAPVTPPILTLLHGQVGVDACFWHSSSFLLAGSKVQNETYAWNIPC